LLALLLATLSALIFVLFAALSLPLLITWFDYRFKRFIKPGLYERCGCSSAYRVLALPTRATPIKTKSASR
jgi:hypothetical protein